MKNKEIAHIFYEIADLLEMEDVQWKPRAYRRAARSIESLSEPIEEVYKRGELEEIDGVGESLAKKVAEFLDTGKMEYYRELKEEIPVDIEALTSVEGVGPKTVEKVYQKLGVKSLADLEKAAREGKIADIEGFGEKSQENILKHIPAAKKGHERMLLGRAFPIADNIRCTLEESKHFDKVEIVGSFRRRRPTVGDIDILATSSSPEKAMEEFTALEDVKEVLGKGETKASIVVSGDLHMDLRIVEKESWGSALLYFTGSKDHNITLRNLAIEKGYKLNEYGLFKGDEKEAGASEKEVYKKLGLEYIAPELREDTGEIDAAQKGQLPDLIKEEDLRGDLQMHTRYSDGNDTIEDLAQKADDRGYEYILITDHGPSLHVAGGPQSKEDLQDQAREIKEANENHQVTVLQGMEANITDDGLDITEDMLDMLDLVAAALHNRLDNPTEKILRAFENSPVHIFVHPLNRRINKREDLDLDMDQIVKKAKEKKIALEINSQPERLDLPWDLVKKYRGQVKFVISTDAHRADELDLIHLGVAQARRGWLEKKDVLNTWSLKKLRSYFQ